MRILTLVSFFVAAFAQTCTVPPANVINTGAELNIAVGSPYTFTCVAGSTADGLESGSTTFTANCVNTTSLAQWSVAGCILYPNFCNNANQARNRLSPAFGGLLGERGTFLCAPGHTLAYASSLDSLAGYQRVSAFSAPTQCEAMSYDDITDTFFPDNQFGIGRWVSFDSNNVPVPVYCEPISGFCPSEAKPFASVFLSASDELVFTTNTTAMVRDASFFGFPTPTLNFNVINRVADESDSTCQAGFVTDLFGSPISAPRVVCVAVNNYAANGGQWRYVGTSQAASCVKRENYCSAINNPGPWVNSSQLYPLFSNFTVDAASGLAGAIPAPEAEIVCRDGFAIYPDDRSTSKHPLHCVPKDASVGDYKVFNRAAVAPYDLADFVTSIAGQTPCTLTLAYCSTETSEQSPSFPFDYNSEVYRSKLNETVPMNCLEGYEWTAGVTQVTRQCRTGDSNLYLSGGGIDVSRQWGFFVQPGDGPFLTNSARSACSQISTYCSEPTGFSVYVGPGAFGSPVTSAVASTIDTATMFYQDCPAGSSSTGLRNANPARVYCAGVRTGSEPSWSATGIWSTVESSGVVTAATCTNITDFCQQGSRDGDFVVADAPIASTTTRTCDNGYSASTGLIPAFDVAPVAQNLVCVVDTSGDASAGVTQPTGQTGKWVTSTGDELTDCVKSTNYCQDPVLVQSSGNWSSAGASGLARTIDTTWSARCVAGFSLTGAKASTATSTLTCRPSSSAVGCWSDSPLSPTKRASTCSDDVCTIVPDYCTVPPNVTFQAGVSIGTTVNLVCEEGYTTDGLVATVDNVDIDATCAAFPSWGSSGTDPAGVWSTSSGTFGGCLPAGSYCTITANVVTPLAGVVNQVDFVLCSLGYRIKNGTTPACYLPAETRQVSATCNPVSPQNGLWEYATGCEVECEQIPNFCPTDTSLFRSSLSAATYTATASFTCKPGTTRYEYDDGATSVSRAEILNSTLMAVITSSPDSYDAICTTTGTTGANTVRGVWRNFDGNPRVYPRCVLVSDFCTNLPSSSFGSYTVLSAVPVSSSSTLVDSLDVTDAAAGTGSVFSSLVITCDEGFALDRTPQAFESNNLGPQMAPNHYFQDIATYVCSVDGEWNALFNKDVISGGQVCSRVGMCTFPSSPPILSITSRLCYNPDTNVVTLPPCAFEAPATFFCRVGFLPQPASAPGYYDIGADRSQISASVDATCDVTGVTVFDQLSTDPNWDSTSTPSTLDYWTTSRTWSFDYTTISGSPTWLPAADQYRYEWQWTRNSDDTPITQSSLCIRSNNFCSTLTPHPNRSAFLANVHSLNLSSASINRAVDVSAEGLTCEKGYQIVVGLNRELTTESTVASSVRCQGNLLIPQAGEWSVLGTDLQYRPVGCNPIVEYCQPTLGAFASLESAAGAGRIGTAGTYCCQAGYSTTGVSAAGSFASLPITCSIGPSTLDVFAKDGLWLNGLGSVPSCLLITDYCPVVSGSQLSTTSAAGSIGSTATYTCAAGYQLQGQGGLKQASFVCTPPSSSCGQGTNSGTFLLNGVTPSCVPVNPYCPVTTITMINSTGLTSVRTNGNPSTLGATQPIVCAPGWSSNGLAGTTNAVLTTTCTAGTPDVGVWAPSSCLPTVDYCAASTLTNDANFQTISLFNGEQDLDAIARVECDTGYTIGGATGGLASAFITCRPAAQGFGRWELLDGSALSPNFCQAANRTCSLAPPNAVLGSNATGSTDSWATYTCVTGFTFTGLAAGSSSGLAQCLFSDKLWHVAGAPVSCSQATDWCPSAVSYNTLNVGSILTLSSSPTYNSIGAFSCRNGFASVSTQATCQIDRTWSATPCSLVPAYCDNADLGTILAPGPATSTLGQSRNVTCAVGYQFISGLFLEVPVNCSALSSVRGVYKDGSGIDAFCGPTQSYCPTTVQNGALTVSGALEIGSSAFLTCSNGYALASGLRSTSVTCAANDRSSGVWSNAGTPQACSPIADYCPSTIALVAPVAATATVVGSTQLMSCPTGWQASPGFSSATVTCSVVDASRGQWTFGSGSAWTGCVQIPNFCPSGIPGATLANNTGTIDTVVEATCEPGSTQNGFKNGATVFDVVCTSSGWTDATLAARCSVVSDFCDVLGPSRATAETTAATLGSTNVFDCDLGFYLNGSTSVTVTCSVSSAWVIGGESFSGCVVNPDFCPETQEENAVVGNGTNRFNAARTVTCNPGYQGTGVRTCGSDGQWSPVIVCTDVNECVNNPCPANNACVNGPGNYTCIPCAANEVENNGACECNTPLWTGVAGNCQCSCTQFASCGANACECDVGYASDPANPGSCTVCGAATQPCCTGQVCQNATDLTCLNGICTVPVPPPPPPTPVPVPVPVSPPPPSGGSSSADDVGRLAVLFAYLLL